MIEILPKELSPLLESTPLYPLNKYYYQFKSKIRDFIRREHENDDLDREKYLVESFRSFFANEIPFFYQIQIETCSFCNEKCAFCPANVNDDIRGKNFMSEEIYDKILADLKTVNFTGMISLFNNNEPMIDKRLESFIKLAKTELPKATVEIISNGSLINVKRFNDMFEAGLDSLVIDNYYKDEKRPTLTRSMQKLIEDIKTSPWKDRVYVPVYMRYQQEVLTNRAGNAPNKKEQEKKQSIRRFCPYPFMQFNVNYEGKVNLCCNDVYYQGVVGDITKNSIKEIWEAKLYQDIRKKILDKDRDHGICAGCDATNNLHGPVLVENSQIQIPEYVNGSRDDDH